MMTARKACLTAVLTVCLTISAAWAEAPLADRLPGGSLLYVGGAGRTLSFSGSMLGQLLDEPATGQMYAALKQAAMAEVGGGAEGTFVKNLWQMGEIAWKHPLALAVTEVRPPSDSGPPSVSAALVIDLKGDRTAFAEHLEKALAAIPEDENPFREATHGEVNYRTMPLPMAGGVSFGFHGDLFFLAVGEDMPAALLDLKPADSLAAEKRFTAALAGVDGENVQVACFLDFRRGTDLSLRFTPVLPGGPDPKAILAGMGLDKLEAAAGTVRVVDRGMLTRIKVYTPAPHQGVLAALAGPPLTDADLKGLPADALYAGAMNLSPGRFFDEIRKAVGEIDPDAAEEMDEGIAELNEQLGLDVRKELLASLGDTWQIASAPSLGGILTGTVLSVEIKDAQTFNVTMGKLLARAQQSFGRGRRAPRFGVSRIGRTDIHYVTIPDREMPLSPAWAVHDGRLYLAAWPQVVQAALAGEQGKALTAHPAFARAREHLSAKPVSMSFVNIPAVVRLVYPVGLIGWNVIAAEMRDRLDVEVSPTWLPALSSFEKYLWPTVTAVSAEEDGIVFEEYGSVPGFSGLASMSSAISMLMPALTRARSQARFAKSMANLNGLGKAIALYQGSHDDQFPPNLDVLVEEGLIDPSQLVMPSSDHNPPRLSRGRLIGSLDYAYVQPPQGVATPADFIMAYERPDLARRRGLGGIAVLHRGINVTRMTFAQFHRAMDRNEKILREARR